MSIHRISDIHMHCVWDVDDGSTDRDMTRELLKISCSQGVTRIACTSHGNALYSQEKYDIQFAKLKQLVDEEFPGLQVCTGTEIRVHAGEENTVINMLKNGRLHFLGNSEKALIELSVHAPLEVNLSVVNKLIAEGLQVVIAHAERYHHFAESIADMEDIVSRGCQIQVNAYSLFLDHNPFIITKAHDLVQRQLVHFIGSDAHRTSHRPPMLEEGINWLYQNVPQDYADQIVYSNAEEFFL